MGGRDSRVLLESYRLAAVEYRAKQKQWTQTPCFKTESLSEGLSTLGWHCGHVYGACINSVNLCRKKEPTVGGTIP